MQAFQCVSVVFVTHTALAKYLPNMKTLNSFFKKRKYNIHDMFNILIRNNEQFDQNLHHIFKTF